MGLCEPVVTHSATAVGAGVATMRIRPLGINPNPPFNPYLYFPPHQLPSPPAPPIVTPATSPSPLGASQDAANVRNYPIRLPIHLPIQFPIPPTLRSTPTLISFPFLTYLFPTLSVKYLTPSSSFFTTLPILVVYIVADIAWLVGWGGTIFYFLYVFFSC